MLIIKNSNTKVCLLNLDLKPRLLSCATFSQDLMKRIIDGRELHSSVFCPTYVQNWKESSLAKTAASSQMEIFICTLSKNEFSHWINQQKYTPEKSLIKQLTYLRLHFFKTVWLLKNPLALSINMTNTNQS